ncbi:hypothetical protein EDEG_03845 [Edhazardia aedis USNM 41457]|uniref:PCI domain-containing protein n=1 Tax=Edhazardia aedis (strain USNM 41457) TaxID=1003232 RepID=J9DJU3_EDHAE|nr:hypothetical protein EDEG_03845 [Edhazardia aedis USNM 41457]|eukprot:EJW01612.1 hypothetical protein EDEG_03845 [Edhazardia aedis USNM 41457]
MDINFSKPTLEILKYHDIFKNTQNVEPLLQYVIENNMLSYYNKMCAENEISEKKEIRKKIEENIKKQIEEIQSDQSKELSENDLLQNDIALSAYYASILDYQNFEKSITSILERNPSPSLRMDTVLCKIRMYLILNKKKSLYDAINAGKDIIEHGCDWDRRNKFKSYYALYLVQKRDFTNASDLFYDSLPTFDSPEIMDYNSFVVMFIFCGLLSFTRDEVKLKIVDNGNVNETRMANEEALELVECFITCDYHNILLKIYSFCKKHIKSSVFLHELCNKFIYMFIARIFKQLLESYKSLNIGAIAQIFDVSDKFVEDYMFKFIVEKNIEARIDGITKNVFVIDNEVNKDIFLAEKGDTLMRNITKNIK